MTTNTTTHGRVGLGRLTPATFLRAWSARAAERRELVALRRLDDRLLRDVGLTRADVDSLTGNY